MHDLNPPQRDAVKYLDGPLLVLAGAGSGKTRVITRKIVYLVTKANIAAHHIVAVTFTNKAAREMKARLKQTLSSDLSRGLKVSTFHRLGLTILKREHKAVGLKSSFTLMDQEDATLTLRELLKSDKFEDQAQSIQWQISQWKNQLITPAAAISHAGDEQQLMAARYYEAYQSMLLTCNAVDFDDLLMLPVQIFRNHPDILDQWQNRIRYLLVDEYQDTNGSQYELVKQLTGTREALTVVGDDDQSIYAWRGARPENLARLKDDFPRLKIIKLEQNYRSMARILKAANRLIDNNPHVFQKRLWSDLGAGDMLRVIQCRNEQDEASRVASEILHHHYRHTGRFGHYAILYRGNHQARIFEKALRTQNVPYSISGGQSFFSRSEIKDVMAYLRLLANPEDDAAFMRIINVPQRGIGLNTLQKLAAYAGQRGIVLNQACDELGLAEHLRESAFNKVRGFKQMIDHYRQQVHEQPISAAVTKLLTEIDYLNWLREQGSSPKATERRQENVQELLDWLQKLQDDENRPDSPGDLVNHLTLMDVLERQEEDDTEEDRVRLMTLHSAKGLEFPHVFMVGMEEDLLPHHSSIEEDNIEEERRLAYVGITRARQTLTMTLAAKRKKFGELTRCEPSRFLAELPEEDLSWEGRGNSSPEQVKEKGSAHLAGIRALLSPDT